MINWDKESTEEIGKVRALARSMMSMFPTLRKFLAAFSAAFGELKCWRCRRSRHWPKKVYNHEREKIPKLGQLHKKKHLSSRADPVNEDSE